MLNPVPARPQRRHSTGPKAQPEPGSDWPRPSSSGPVGSALRPRRLLAGYPRPLAASWSFLSNLRLSLAMAWRAYRLLPGREECSWLGHLVIGQRQQRFCLLAASHLPRPGAYGCRVFFLEDSQRLLPLTGLWLARTWGEELVSSLQGAQPMLACPLPTHASPGPSAIKLVLVASYHPMREPQGLLWWP